MLFRSAGDVSVLAVADVPFRPYTVTVLVTDAPLCAVKVSEYVHTPVFFIALELTDAKGNVLSRNFYWRSTNKYEGKNTVTGPCTGGFEPLGTLPEAKPTVTARRLADKNGFSQWEVTIKNGKRIAFFCQLLLTDAEGQPLHGTYYSDNFISLLPGQKQTITIRTPQHNGQSYRLRFCENMGAVKQVAIK